MLTVLGFCDREVERTRDLLRWIGELGPLRHRLLLVASYRVPVADLNDLITLARPTWQSVRGIRQRVEDERPWPMASNALFRVGEQGARHPIPEHFLWLEPDAIPMRTGWLDAIEAEYRRAAKPFMGCVYPHPFPHLNGVAVYPAVIRRFNPHMLTDSAKPWDCVEPQATLRYAHATPLIQRSLADPAANAPHHFETESDVESVVSADTMLFHGCKDGSLIAVLRKLPLAPTRPVVAPPSPTKAQSPKPAPQQRRVGYYHSGNLGDVVYALAAIAAHGGGELTIGPKQEKTAPCSNPIVRSQFELLKPLLEAQAYIKAAKFSDVYQPSLLDLNGFRHHWFELDTRLTHGINTLCHAHFYILSITDRFDSTKSWLTVPAPQFSDQIIVARSLRHRNWFFPWARVLKRYGKRLLFVGLPEEHERFVMCWGDINYRPTRNFLDMAQVIAGAKGFIGNQSFPCALAIGLGTTVLQEVYAPSPDCIFPRENFFTNNQVDEFDRALC